MGELAGLEQRGRPGRRGIWTPHPVTQGRTAGSEARGAPIMCVLFVGFPLLVVAP